MRLSQVFAICAAFAFLAACLHADCIKDHDHRSSPTSGLLITDFTIAGTQTLSSEDLSAITNELIGSCFDENSEEIEQRVRSLFQDRGYFTSVVKGIRVRPSDPIAVPKSAILEAEVQEGPRYRMAEIGFAGNRAFTAAELGNEFPIKTGDLFMRNKIASGLDNLRKLYATNGFIDEVSMPDTENHSDAAVILSVIIGEGPQYHMGKLEIFAPKEIADKLRTAWALPEGAVFDDAYLDKFVDSNRSLLPPGFQREQ